MDDMYETDADAVIATTLELAKMEKVELAENTLIVLPEGKKLHDLKPFLDARRFRPERHTGTAVFTDLESFIAHARRFADVNSAIFAIDDPKAPRLTSVINYHEARLVGGSPRFGDHRGTYAFPLSEEWKAWQAISGRVLSQSDFCAFLEDHLQDVVEPAGVGEKTKRRAEEHGVTLASQPRLLELANGLALHVESKVVQFINPNTGEKQIIFEETHSKKGSFKVPDGFVIGIPVFRGGAPYQLVCRLRYRRHEQRVVWTIALHRADESFRDAFTEAAQRASVQTELPLFYGTPEGG